MTRIAIFDSGVGGLSIYQEIKKQLPNSQYIFVSDNAAFPYGTKPEEELKQRVIEVVAKVHKQFSPNLLVIACNTASTVVLPELRDQFSFPIVGVVPAIKPAAALTKTNVIGLLATPATIKRDYTLQLIADFAPKCEVVKVGSSALVQIAEDKLRGKGIDYDLLKYEVQPFLENKSLDVLVLACTHFPLINKEIFGTFEPGSDIKLLDSGRGIANRVVQLLSEAKTDFFQEEKSLVIFTEMNSITSNFVEKLAQLGLGKVNSLE